MTYKQFFTAGGQIDATRILRVDDNVTIPADPGNRDYKDYQAWVAAGNTPLPPDPLPPPSPYQDVVAKYRTDAGQSIPNNAVTVVNFEDKDYDTNNAVAIGAAWKFTTPVAGTYLITCKIAFVAGTGWSVTETAEIQLFKNGVFMTSLGRYKAAAAHTNEQMIPGMTTTLVLAVGDTLYVAALQTSGAAASLIASRDVNELCIERIGP